MIKIPGISAGALIGIVALDPAAFEGAGVEPSWWVFPLKFYEKICIMSKLREG